MKIFWNELSSNFQKKGWIKDENFLKLQIPNFQFKIFIPKFKNITF